MLATQAPRRIWLFNGLKAFSSHRRSNQASQAGPIDSDYTTAPGRLLNGRYKITQALGAGGFSQTYLAKDIHRPSTPTCVVKHFQPASSDLSFLQTAQRLFQAEAEILEMLGHHNQIPQLLAYFEEKQNFYLVEEYVDGLPLSAEIQLGHCWSDGQVVQLLQDVLDLLVFIHSRGVIHRDIKPDNLIRRQQDQKLVLIDFGTIKQVRTQTVTPQGHRIATTPIGTQGYIAAEQGQGNPRPNSDLYALGIIAIQALTGLDPTQLQHDPDTGEVCWQEHATVSSELAAVINKLTTYHFKDRYQSAVEVLEALEPSMKMSDSPKQLYSQLQASAPKPSSILLPGVLSAEPTPDVIVPINPSEEPIDLDGKSKKWIWTGVGTGLASAVALSAVISSIPESPVPSAKPNNLIQSTARPDNAKNASIRQAAPFNTPLQRDARVQTANAGPFRTSEPIPAQRDLRSTREQPSVKPPRVVAATANPSQPAKLQAARQQPSSRSPESRVITPTPAKPSLEAEPIQKPDQLPITQDVSESNIDHRQVAQKNLAELKIAFGKLAAAIAVADEALDQNQEAAMGSFDDLGEAIARLQEHVGTLTLKQQIAAHSTSLDQQLVPSPEVNIGLNQKLEPTATKDSLEAQDIKTPPANSPNEQELLPKTALEPLDTSSTEAVIPAEELEQETAPGKELEIMTRPVLETISDTSEELEVTPTTSTEEPPKATSEELPEALPTDEQKEAITPVSNKEPSSEAVLKEQPALSKKWLEEQPESVIPTQAEEAVIEESSEQTVPTRSATDELLNRDSANELEASEGTLNEPLEIETAPANSSVISPDGQFLAGTSDNRTIKIWNVQTGELVSTLTGSLGNVQSVAFSSDSQTLTSTDTDGTTTTWNLSTSAT